jgi:hypothetical protein
LLSNALLDSVRTYTDSVVSKAKTDQIASYRESHKSKAMIRTYMAWQDPPDIQYIGLAIKSRVFQNLETTCQTFIEWLRALFGVISQQATQSQTTPTATALPALYPPDSA